MKTFLAGLQNSVSSTYNSAQTSALGRAFQKLLNSQNVIGPALTGFIDVQSIVGTTGLIPYFDYVNNRLYVLSIASANPTVMLFNFSTTTGAYSYVGKVVLSLASAAATTHTFRGFKVQNIGGLINLILFTTGSIVINGGAFVAYGLNISQFTPAGVTIFFSNNNSTGSMYFLQDPTQYGVLNTITTTWGGAAPWNAVTAANRTRIFMLNNTVAIPQLYAWDLATAPVVAGQVVNGVSSSTSAYITSPQSNYFQMAAQNGYSPTNGEPVVLQNGTTNVPANFNQWASGTAQVAAANVYFMRDLLTVATFTCSAANATGTATYITSTGVTVTVSNTISGGTTLTTYGSSTFIPPSGTLTKTGGSGDATITYSAVSFSNWYFNLSTTSGGAAVVPTTSSATFTMLRAFGTSGNSFYGKAINFSTLTGTIVQANAIHGVVPINPPLNPGLGGVDCLSLSTQTQNYLGKLSDLFITQTGSSTFNSLTLTVGSTTGLAAGQAVYGPGIQLGTTIASVVNGTTLTLSLVATSTNASQTYSFGTSNWASLTGANITGTGIDIVVPTLTFSGYSNELDCFVYADASTTFVQKKLQNGGSLVGYFGCQQIGYYEGNNPQTVQLGAFGMSGMDVKNGWLFVVGNTAGQRGVFFIDMYSDQQWGYSQVISKVLSVQAGSVLKYINSLKQLFLFTDRVQYAIRNGTSAGDAAFATATSGTWTTINTDTDLSGTAIGPYFQIRIQFYSTSGGISTSPAQVNDVEYTVQLPGESSDNWALDNDSTTQAQASPNYIGFYLLTAYASSVPTLYARVYDTSGNLVFSANTSSNPTVFQYSTDGGTTWNSLGTIPNVVGTKVRALVTPTPSVTALPSIRES